MPFDPILLGQPVELGQIARELKKLWESAGGAKSRASLVNFAVYCLGREALESNTKLISDFTRNHACRAILLASVPNAPESGVKAWINAHCHLNQAGAKQVCCEQLTFLLEGHTEQLLANVLFANLDSDLPLYFWWQGEFAAQPNEQLWTWIDRLIFDSRDWREPRQQLAILQHSRKHAGARMILCDLNWTRTLHLRQAVAQTFDHPENLAQLCRLQRVALAHAPGFASTALLFLAWIAAQLGWEFVRREAGNLTFRSRDQSEVACVLQAVEGAPISSCELISADASIALTRAAGSAFFRSEFRCPGGGVYQHLLPAGEDGAIHLLDDELTFGGQHRVYVKVLGVVERLF
jgi:glucose-6-phosphate dehydrogenase assembly protein OpcA